ncbi:unnamed protein product [Amoebophrya sp. A120]|nr:unnamed protein product [Amoebophrya sp. A120]|eukprot:GSA120T00002775001.1
MSRAASGSFLSRRNSTTGLQGIPEWRRSDSSDVEDDWQQYEVIKLNTRQLRFTQDSISEEFRKHARHGTVENTVQNLITELLACSDEDPECILKSNILQVAEHPNDREGRQSEDEKVYYAISNRRAYAYMVARPNKIVKARKLTDTRKLQTHFAQRFSNITDGRYVTITPRGHKQNLQERLQGKGDTVFERNVPLHPRDYGEVRAERAALLKKYHLSELNIRDPYPNNQVFCTNSINEEEESAGSSSGRRAEKSARVGDMIVQVVGRTDQEVSVCASYLFDKYTTPRLAISQVFVSAPQSLVSGTSTPNKIRARELERQLLTQTPVRLHTAFSSEMDDDQRPREAFGFQLPEDVQTGNCASDLEKKSDWRPNPFATSVFFPLNNSSCDDSTTHGTGTSSTVDEESLGFEVAAGYGNEEPAYDYGVAHAEWSCNSSTPEIEGSSLTLAVGANDPHGNNFEQHDQSGGEHSEVVVGAQFFASAAEQDNYGVPNERSSSAAGVFDESYSYQSIPSHVETNGYYNTTEVDGHDIISSAVGGAETASSSAQVLNANAPPWAPDGSRGLAQFTEHDSGERSPAQSLGNRLSIIMVHSVNR